MKRFCLLLLLVMCIGLSGCSQQTINDSMDDYMQTNVPLTMEITIFPVRESLVEAVVEDYRCITYTTLLFDDICFLLQCGYDETTFTAETARFQEMGAQYREDLFLMPAWVMQFGGHYYEYALIDAETRQIIYIAAETPSLEDFEEIPEKYLPVVDTEIINKQYAE